MLNRPKELSLSFHDFFHQCKAFLLNFTVNWVTVRKEVQALTVKLETRDRAPWAHSTASLWTWCICKNQDYSSVTSCHINGVRIKVFFCLNISAFSPLTYFNRSFPRWIWKFLLNPEDNNSYALCYVYVKLKINDTFPSEKSNVRALESLYLQSRMLLLFVPNPRIFSDFQVSNIHFRWIARRLRIMTICNAANGGEPWDGEW